MLNKNEFICFIALLDDDVVGGLTAYELPLYYSSKSEVYNYDLAVKSTFQKTGVGTKLIETLSAYCKQNGIIGMFVEANEEDKHAIAFYHKTGGMAENVVHFNFAIP